jgi:hypothetical protein
VHPCTAWSNTPLQSRGSHCYCRSCHCCCWQHYYRCREDSSRFGVVELAKFDGILMVEKLTKTKTVNPYRGQVWLYLASCHREVKLRQVINLLHISFSSSGIFDYRWAWHLKTVLKDSFFRNKTREWKASEMNHWPTPGCASWYSECICWSKWTVNRQTSVYLEFMTRRETIGSRTYVANVRPRRTYLVGI